MVRFLTHMLACYGVVFVAVESQVLQNPRLWLMARSRVISELLSCWFCTGFWVAAVVHVVVDRDAVTMGRYMEDVVVGSFAGATFTYALNVLLLTLESHHGRSDQQN